MSRSEVRAPAGDSAGRAEVVRAPTGFGPAGIVLVGVWFGAATGLFEIAANLASIHGLGVITYDTLRTNRHHAWMTPASNIALFLGLAIVHAAASRAFAHLRRAEVVLGVPAAAAAWSLALAIPGLQTFARVAVAAGLATAAVRAILARRGAFRRVVAWSTPVGLAVAVAAIAPGATPGSRPPRALERPGGPNVVLIVLDTVRADSTTPYGSARDTTPNLARLAREGVLFRNARSTASWTLPSHASLFTGRWPFELSADVGRPLDREFPTLAEELSRRGYATAGFVANTENCNAWYGLARGFDRYEDFYENATITPLEVLRNSRLGRYAATSRLGTPVVEAVAGKGAYRYRKSAAMINRDALAWLDGRGDRPFFLFLNYFDAHDPYIPPAEADRRFSDASAGPGSGALAARNAYDDCLTYLDAQVGRLLDDLKRRGELDDTLIVVTADHGEGFGEHGLAGHGVSLYRPETHIPMLVVAPGRVPAGLSPSQPVSLRDVAPTVLDLVDGPAAAAAFPGESLAEAWRAAGPAEEDDDEPEPVLTELDRAEAVPEEVEDAPARLGLMRSLVTETHTYILNGDGREELYELATDPDERNDLAALPEAEPHLQRFRDLMRPLAEVD